MTDAFVDRLREAVIDPQTVDVEAMHEAVRGTAKKLRTQVVLDVVRIAYGRWEGVHDEGARLRTNLNSDAPVVKEAGQRQLVSVLAASSLIESYSGRSTPASVLSALAIRCAQRIGWVPVHQDLPSHSETFLLVQAHAARQIPNVPSQVSTLRGETPEGDAAALRERLTKQVESLREAVNGLIGAHALHRLVESEQRDIMWWLARAREKGVGPTDHAVTLASLTRILPGPVATDELFAARLRKDGIRELQTPIEATALPDASDMPDVPSALSDFCPLLVTREASALDGPSIPVNVVVRAIYDELMLTRAFNATPVK